MIIFEISKRRNKEGKINETNAQELVKFKNGEADNEKTTWTVVDVEG